MFEKDKVSVIVPVYKVEKYLKRCVDSILNQTYQNIEVILVDDGSPDGCGKIIDSYAEKDERIIAIHKENAGQSIARNEAMKLATGEFFCFVDADDYLHERQIERLIELMFDHGADISMVHFCNFSGEFVSPEDMTNRVGNSGMELEASQMVEMKGIDCIHNMHMVSDELYVVVWGKLFKRSLFEGIHFPEGRICEDLAILYRLFERAKHVVYSKEIMYYYFRGNNNSSTFCINEKFYQDVFLALEEEIEFLSQKHKEMVNYPRKTYLYWIFDYYRKLMKADPKANQKKCKELHERYQRIFQESKDLKKEKFYTAFYYFPKLYIKCKGVTVQKQV